MRKSAKGYASGGMFPSDPGRFRTVFLYVIQCHGYIKVGISADPEKRCRVLMTDNPFPCVLVAKRKLPACMASKAEFEAHTSLSHAHHRNEWFTVEPQKAVEAIDASAKRARTEGAALEKAQRAAGPYKSTENASHGSLKGVLQQTSSPLLWLVKSDN